MKGKINSAGFLLILRPRPGGARWEHANCRDGKKPTCGDHCVFFGEPFEGSKIYQKGRISLPLCMQTLVFESIIDERNSD